MSYQPFLDDVLFYQQLLKASGLYTGGLDGAWGPLTAQADADFAQKSSDIASQFGTFDARSEEFIVTLIPQAQIEARKFLQLVSANAEKVKIICGTRTYAEQDALYSQGRNGNPGKIVTDAKGGESNHNFGIAWDIGLFDALGNYDEGDANYITLGNFVMPQVNTLEWGGSWVTFPDNPHYQLKAVSDNVAVIRGLFESGQPYLT